MKKIYIVLVGALVASAALTGCAKEDSAPTLKEYTFQAGINADIPAIDEDGNEIMGTKTRYTISSNQFAWNNGDKAGIFIAATPDATPEGNNISLAVLADSYPATSAKLKGSMPGLSGENYMLYAYTPYNENATFTGGRIQYPFSPYYFWDKNNTFLGEPNKAACIPMFATGLWIGASTNPAPSLNFGPAGSFIKMKLELKEKHQYYGVYIKQIEIYDNDGKPLSGMADIMISAEGGTIQSFTGDTGLFARNLYNSWSGFVDKGVSQEVVIFVPTPMETFKNGLTIEATATTNVVYTAKTTTPLTLTAGKMYNFPTAILEEVVK